MGFNIFLNQYKSKKGSKKTMILPVDLEQECNKSMYEFMEGDLSQVDVYNKERQACTEIRLNVNVVPVISNVLTNYKTEIVRFEGSDSAVSLTYHPLSSSDAVDGASPMKVEGDKTITWTDVEAIRDTQLSRSGLSYTYHCGIDIFSNFHFRVDSDNFKSVCRQNKSNTKMYDKNSMTYNTIWDYMREYNGLNVSDVNEYNNNSYIGPIHMFTAEEIYEPSGAVLNYQREENGWYGFKNISKLRAYDDNNNSLEIQSPICSRSSNDFIDLTPERDLFNFYPKWNSYRSRDEKNWNYVITYPYSSTTEISFIRSNTDSLRIASYDEVSNNGYTYFTTVSRNNLKAGDFVNIYSGDDILLSKAKVISVGSGTTDDINLNQYYIFKIKTIQQISDRWMYKDDSDDESYAEYRNNYPKLDDIEDIKSTYGQCAYYTTDGKYAYDSTMENKEPIPIFTDSVINPEMSSLDLSVKRIENGMECSYYVRINAKLPNFNGALDVIDEYGVQNDDHLISDYSMHSDCLFSNENAKLGFSKTIYNDNVGSITYTENIPFKYLLDNRHLPLHDIFFTVFKNNKGYKKWYNDKITADEEIEYSHVFGKLTCAFELSRDSERIVNEEMKPLYKTIHTINNIDDDYDGETISILNKDYRDDTDDSDEINWSKNRFFYNDLVEYSRGESKETSIQQIQYRFNTAQRELNGKNDDFTEIVFDAINTDDYDYAKFEAGLTVYIDGDEETDNLYHNLFRQKEGYYYQPHYRIPVMTVSSTKNTSNSRVLPSRKDTKLYGDNQILFVTDGDNYAELDTKVIFHNSYYDKYYYGVVKGIKNTNAFIADLYDDYDLTKPITGDNLTKIVLSIQNTPNTTKYIKPNTENPSYADFMEDGSFMFQWREILPNGYDDNDEEVYPFANNFLYVDKKIVFFLRRQWWDRQEEINTDKFPAERSGKAVNTFVFDEYVDDDDINCL